MITIIMWWRKERKKEIVNITDGGGRIKLKDKNCRIAKKNLERTRK